MGTRKTGSGGGGGSWTKAKIKRWHAQLVGNLGEFHGGERVEPVDRSFKEYWQASSAKAVPRKTSSVIFALFGGTCLTAQRDVGQPLCAFGLDDRRPQSASLLWSWSEDWKLVNGGEFRRIGVGLTFYKVIGEAPRQVLRAEWDDPLHRGPNSAQPHWHFDAPFGGSDTDSLLPELGEPLLPEASEPLPRVSASGLHLYMSGWGEKSQQHPKCFQASFGDRAVIDWACRTLEYVRAEAHQLKTV